MAVLRLIQLGSYNGYGIQATAKNPLVKVDPDIARKLIATGYFSLEGALEEEEAEAPIYEEKTEAEPENEEAETLEEGNVEATEEPDHKKKKRR